MPNLNIPEHEADLAEARFEGAKSVGELIRALQGVGLGVEALTGAIDGHLVGLARDKAEKREAAVASREKPAEA
jgi:hypothetical protein